MAVRAHVYVSGRVQGVGFRYSTYHAAQRLGLGGWVRNLEDGRVEAVFEGDEPTVQRMLGWCRQGPTGAFVENLDVTWDQTTDPLSEFRIEPSAEAY
jgi:acylphosphatase